MRVSYSASKRRQGNGFGKANSGGQESSGASALGWGGEEEIRSLEAKVSVGGSCACCGDLAAKVDVGGRDEGCDEMEKGFAVLGLDFGLDAPKSVAPRSSGWSCGSGFHSAFPSFD